MQIYVLWGVMSDRRRGNMRNLGRTHKDDHSSSFLSVHSLYNDGLPLSPVYSSFLYVSRLVALLIHTKLIRDVAN